MSAQPQTSHNLSAQDYLAWEAAQPERHEFVDGEVFAMAGAEDRHVTVTGNVYMALRQHLRGTPCRTFMADMKVQAHADSSYFYPDVLVTCSAADADSRQIKREPRLIVEVLSPSTAAHDQIAKRRTYERAGVREYWLVHPGDRTLTVYVLDNGQYGRPDIYELKDETPIGVLPGVSIAWDALVERLPKPEY